MDIKRTIPIILNYNSLVDATVVEFNRYQRVISPVGFNEGKPLRALDLHHAVYHQTPTELTSQMWCSAIRTTAAAYAAAKSNRRPAKRPFVFPYCNHAAHADVNASLNILSRFTVLRDSGPLSTGPEALPPGKGKPPVLAGGG